MRDRLSREVIRLACARMERQLSAVQTKQLEDLLHGNSIARGIYIEFLELAATLHWQRSAGLQARVFGNDGLPGAATVESPTVGKSTEQERASTSVGASSRPPRTIKSAPVRLAFSPRIAAAVLCSLLVAYFTGLALFVSLRARTPEPSLAKSSNRPTHFPRKAGARITSDAGCVWQSLAGVAIDPRNLLERGESLSLKTGVAEIDLDSGVRLIFEGPTRFTIPAIAQCDLRMGRLTAYVPRRAVGFTVITPTATVVDLGTEFGVEALADGTTEVHVLQGEVEASSHAAEKPRRIVANRAMRFDATKREFKPIAVDRERFPSRVDAKETVIAQKESGTPPKKRVGKLPSRTEATPPQTDWREDWKAAEAAQAADNKPEAAKLYAKVARDEKAAIGERWHSVVRAEVMNPDLTADLLPHRAEIAAQIGKQSDMGNYYFQAAATYQKLGKQDDALKYHRKALAAKQSPLDPGAGVHAATGALSRDLEAKGNLAGAAEVIVEHMDRMYDHLPHARDRLHKLADKLNKDILTKAGEPFAAGQELPLVEALKKAERTGKGLPEALQALGVKVPASFADKRNEALAARERASADKSVPSAQVASQWEWYLGSDNTRQTNP